LKTFKHFIVEADQSKSRPFKKWFAGSKIVDESGRPLIVYHGTDKVFTVFDTKNGKDRRTTQQLDFGSHFSSDDEYTKGYSKKGNNSAFYLCIKNPLVLPSHKWKHEEGFEQLLALFMSLKLRILPDMYRGYDGEKHSDIQCTFMNIFALDSKTPSKARQAIINAGYDGIVYEPYTMHGAIGYGAATSNHPKSFIALFPTQIKSAINNNGNFDPTDPDVTQ
jgi:hypothetical protein